MIPKELQLCDPPVCPCCGYTWHLKEDDIWLDRPADIDFYILFVGCCYSCHDDPAIWKQVKLERWRYLYLHGMKLDVCGYTHVELKGNGIYRVFTQTPRNLYEEGKFVINNSLLQTPLSN